MLLKTFSLSDFDRDDDLLGGRYLKNAAGLHILRSWSVLQKF